MTKLNILMRRRDYRGDDRIEILPDGSRPIRFVIRDTILYPIRPTTRAHFVAYWRAFWRL